MRAGLVANAQVRITKTNTGIGKSSQANESGNYTFPDLPPGKYSVTVEHPGFKKETRRDIEVVVNSNTRVDLQLTPGNVSETIEVTGAPPLLQTDRSDVGRSRKPLEIAIYAEWQIFHHLRIQSIWYLDRDDSIFLRFFLNLQRAPSEVGSGVWQRPSRDYLLHVEQGHGFPERRRWRAGFQRR